jgi:hypothetical protein
MPSQAVLIAGGVLAAVIALVWVTRKGNATALGMSAGGAAVELVDGAVTGTVKGVGSVVGLPDTDRKKGEAALAAGDWLGASVYLPAQDFLGAVGSWIGTGVYDVTHSGGK